MNHVIKIMGIDPGLTNTGYNISLFNPATGTLEVKLFDTISAIKVAKKLNKEEYKTYGNIIPLYKYEQILSEIVADHKPEYIVSESAFFCPRTPNAYVSLSLCINAIERVLYGYSKTLYKIAPKAAKQAVSDASASKIAVQEAILKLPDLKIKKPKNRQLTSMVEHEADSIAITYTFVKTVLPGVLL